MKRELPHSNNAQGEKYACTMKLAFLKVYFGVLYLYEKSISRTFQKRYFLPNCLPELDLVFCVVFLINGLIIVALLHSVVFYSQN